MRLMRHPSTIALVAGLVLLLGAVAILRGLLLPQDSGPVAVIWGVSILTLLIGVAAAVLDIQWLRREWEVLSEVGSKTHPVEHAMGLQGPRGDTLIVQRARFIERLRQDESRAPQDIRTHLRSEAVAESARVGSAPRFLGSALLLLAVLGTFAGMKAALPALISAINASAVLPNPGTGAGAPVLAIGPALGPVADAFGANFLALIGALAMSVVAYGAALERRQLLGALDRVSEQKLYMLVPEGAAASALERTVLEMTRSIQSVGAFGERVADLQTDIRTLQTALVDAIGNLQSSFTSSLQRQSINIQSQLTETVGRVAKSMHDVSVVLASTATSYEGLVKGLEERDLGVQKASAEMRDTGNKVSAQIARASDALVRSGDQVAAIGSTIAGIAETVSQHSQRSEEALAEAAGSVQQSSAQIAEQLVVHATTVRELPGVIDRAEQRQTDKMAALAAGHSELVGAWQSDQNGRLEALRVDQLAKLDLLIERQMALRGELVTINDSIQNGLSEGRRTFDARLQTEGEAVRTGFDQMRETIDATRTQVVQSFSEARESLDSRLEGHGEQLFAVVSDQAAKLASLVEVQLALREVLVHIEEAVQRGLPDGPHSWEALLQTATQPLQSGVNQLRGTMESIQAQSAEYYAHNRDLLPERLGAIQQALRQVQDVEQALVALTEQQVFSREAGIQGIGQVSQTTTGIHEELVNLRNLVVARLDGVAASRREPGMNGSASGEHRSFESINDHERQAT